MTPQGKETLNDILRRHKAGDIQDEQAAEAIEQLFKREPVNYKRAYSDLPEGKTEQSTLAGPDKSLAIGEEIALHGFGAADGVYKIMGPKPGTNTLRLGSKL